jgi:hypothetical protein
MNYKIVIGMMCVLGIKFLCLNVLFGQCVGAAIFDKKAFEKVSAIDPKDSIISVDVDRLLNIIEGGSGISDENQIKKAESFIKEMQILQQKGYTIIGLTSQLASINTFDRIRALGFPLPFVSQNIALENGRYAYGTLFCTCGKKGLVASLFIKKQLKMPRDVVFIYNASDEIWEFDESLKQLGAKISYFRLGF